MLETFGQFSSPTRNKRHPVYLKPHRVSGKNKSHLSHAMLQRAHIQKSIIMVLEKSSAEDKASQEAAQKAKEEESKKLKAQEAAYQV